MHLNSTIDLDHPLFVRIRPYVLPNRHFVDFIRINAAMVICFMSAILPSLLLILYSFIFLGIPLCASEYDLYAKGDKEGVKLSVFNKSEILYVGFFSRQYAEGSFLMRGDDV